MASAIVGLKASTGTGSGCADSACGFGWGAGCFISASTSAFGKSDFFDSRIASAKCWSGSNSRLAGLGAINAVNGFVGEPLQV